MNTLVIFLLSLVMSVPEVSVALNDECPGWGSGQDSITNIQNHVLYRDYLREDKFKEAFPFWEKVYSAAPSGSVKHFNDGIKIYKAFYDAAEDEAKKEEYRNKVVEIYNQRIQCLGNEGYVLGRKAFDMFYLLDFPYTEAYEEGKRSIELMGLKTESSTLYPVAYMAVELYKRDTAIVSQDEAVALYEEMQRIAEYNLANEKDKRNREYYQKAIDAVNEKYDEVARWLFDCEYFVKQETPLVDSVWNSIDDINLMLRRLAGGGCEETTTLVAQLDERRKIIRDSVRRANMNEADWVVDNLRNDDFETAEEWYEKAEQNATIGADTMYDISMKMAKIAYATKKNKPKGRQYALKAIKYDPNSGEAFYLIGEMYASSGPDCGPGTGWDSQIVVWPAIDKWETAIRVDPNSEAARKAREKIGQYTKYMPSVEQVFERNLSEGDSFTVPCWIQERTTIRAYNPF